MTLGLRQANHLTGTLAMRFLPAALLLAAAAASPALAQEEDPYAACAAMSGDADRLACFDRTYAGEQAARAEQERLAAQEAERAAELREEEFGFSASDLRDRADRGDEDAAARLARIEDERESEEVELSAEVVEIFESRRRPPVIRLSNGQFWRETSGSTMKSRVREGWNATVTQHWSGAYEMRFEERSGYLRVTRIQ